MKQLVSLNLTTRTAKDWEPPVLTFGESLTLALRFYKNDEGTEIEAPLTVNSLKASVGLTDARPMGGKFAIKIGTNPVSDNTNTTAMLDCNILASKLKDALNAVSALEAYGEAKVVFSSGSWLIFVGDQDQQVPMEIVNNGLWPVSFGRIHASNATGKWVHSLRLTQSSVAFTSAHDIVLPPAPRVTELQQGGMDAGTTWNEVQELYIPPEFRGAFVLKKGNAKSEQMSKDESIDTIQAALQPLGADCFKVDLPLSQKPTIEFVGDYAGVAQALLEVVVNQAPPGDLTFTLKFDRAELEAALRLQGAVTLPLEVRIVATDESDFTDQVVALSVPVTINAPVIWAEMEETPVIDWLRPASPKTYVPFGANQILTGNKYSTQVIGDGDNSVFVLTTGLGTDQAFVFARENISGGRQLVDGTDFSATIDGANQVTVTALTGAPSANGWVVTVIGAQTVAAWASDITVTIAQVTGLQTILDNHSAAIAALQALAGTGALSTPQNAGIVFAQKLAASQDVLFLQDPFILDESGSPKGLPSRGIPLLPAIHIADADRITLPDPLPDPAVAGAGKLYINTGDSAVVIGGRYRGGAVPASGFVGCDGRDLYVASRDGTTKSYYPTAFERELFMVYFNDAQIRLGKSLKINFGVALQLINANTRASWLLEIQTGTAPQDTAPATTGPNLQDIEWSTTPVVRHRIIVTPELAVHTFGVQIGRTADSMLLNYRLYDDWYGNNDAAPASANFALRARLINFDTENSVTSARGWPFYQLNSGLNADGTVNSALPSLTIS